MSRPVTFFSTFVKKVMNLEQLSDESCSKFITFCDSKVKKKTSSLVTFRGAKKSENLDTFFGPQDPISPNSSVWRNLRKSLFSPLNPPRFRGKRRFPLFHGVLVTPPKSDVFRVKRVSKVPCFPQLEKFASGFVLISSEISLAPLQTPLFIYEMPLFSRNIPRRG